MEKNPYETKHSLPVGALSYALPNDTPKLWNTRVMLERGESEFIYDIPRIVGGGNLLNLGEGAGGSAILLAQGLRDRNIEGHVWSVDLYENDCDINLNRSFMERAGVSGLITQVKSHTKNALSQIPVRHFNFIFIDASHKYEDVMVEWVVYASLAPKIIAFHDTNQEEINRVLNEFVVPNPLWNEKFWINRIKAYERVHHEPKHLR